MLTTNVFSLLLAFSSVSGVSGQTIFEGRADDTRLTWFASASCVAYNGSDGGPELHNTGVVGGRTVCMRVPGETSTSSYKMSCLTDASGGILPRGTLSFFRATDCASETQLYSPIEFDDEACVANPPEFGSSSFQAQCLNPLLPPVLPFAGRATVAWSGGGCATDPALSPRTLVDLRMGLCQTVPAAIPGGYKIICSPDGSFSALQIFTDNTCSSMVTSRVLDRDTCAPNDGELFGSYSVTVRCSTLGLQGSEPAIRAPPATPNPLGLGVAASESPSVAASASALASGASPSPSTLAVSGGERTAASFAGAAVLAAIFLLHLA
jgi:hypothetical protein